MRSFNDGRVTRDSQPFAKTPPRALFGPWLILLPNPARLGPPPVGEGLDPLLAGGEGRWRAYRGQGESRGEEESRVTLIKLVVVMSSFEDGMGRWPEGRRNGNGHLK